MTMIIPSMDSSTKLHIATNTTKLSEELETFDRICMSDDTSITGTDSDSEESTNDTTLSDMRGPLPTPRSILKRSSVTEPGYIRTQKNSRTSLPAPCEVAESSIPDDRNLPTYDTIPAKKNVNFDVVQIRSYDQTIGDHPCVSYGPPIQLDWTYEQHENLDLDVYEANRGLSRRNLRQMCMSYYLRKSILERDYGFTAEETSRAKKNANKIKFRREVTVAMLPMMRVENVLESACRKAKRVISI